MAEPPDEAPAVDFVLALGRALHHYGTPAHRLEEALGVVCKKLGLAAEVFSTPTTLIMSFGQPAELRTRMMRVDAGELNLAKLAQVDDLADAVAVKELSLAEGRHRLDAILSAPATYSRLTTTLTHLVTAGSVAVFFGGGWRDVIAAAVIGLGLGLLAQVVRRSSDQARVYELVGAMFAAFAAGAATRIAPISASLVTIASLIVLLPGLSLTVAMTELATRNLISGTARLMSAVIVLLQLAVGVAIGERLSRELFAGVSAIPVPLPTWAQWTTLVAAAIGMSIVVQAERRAIGWILAAAVSSFLGTRYGTAWLGGQLGVLVGAFALGALGNLYARVLDRPALVVIVPAMMLLVPGSMGFRGMASLLAHDTLTGVETVFAMFVVAIAIASGLLVANATLSPRRSL
jgi:uncharacterized membrane protein YjjP (DUF1212 family)